MIIICQGVERSLVHLHFLRWPESNEPIYSSTFRSFLGKISQIPESNAPIIVHCANGVGRAGIIILVDIFLRTLVNKNCIEIFEVLKILRDQRPNIVESSFLYKLAHFLVLDYLTNPPLDELPCDKNLTNNMKIYQAKSNLSIQMEYLTKVRWRDEMMKKLVMYRDEIFIEYNNKLHYINAAYVDGFYQSNKYIVIQQPLPNTQSHFWNLVAQKQCSVIISLNEINLKDKVTDHTN